jgi:hypothetical protein
MKDPRWFLALAIPLVACEPNYPTCETDQVFTRALVDLDEVTGIVPLGNLNPPSHTFPTRHLYFYTGDPGSPPSDPAIVYFPGAGWIEHVERKEYQDGGADYSVQYAMCDELRGYFHHLGSVDPAILDRAGRFKHCSTYSTADQTVTRCETSPNLSVEAGTVVGTVGFYGTVDFGLDDRRRELPFANPNRFTDFLWAACPFDYYSDPPKADLEALLGAWDGSERRTAEPVCGRVAWDAPGTAQGNWVRSDAPADAFLDGYGLALVRDNVDPDRGALSIGDVGTPADGSALLFDPETTGVVNRRFDLVEAGAGVHCYEGWGGGGYALVEVVDEGTLRFEFRTDGSCGFGPWSFDGPLTFVR